MSHRLDEEGKIILDANGKPSPRDIDEDHKNFKRCAKFGYYTRHRELWPGYGFWMLPMQLQGKVEDMRYSTLYNHGFRDAKRRIDNMVAGRAVPSQYGEREVLRAKRSAPSKKKEDWRPWGDDLDERLRKEDADK